MYRDTLFQACHLCNLSKFRIIIIAVEVSWYHISSYKEIPSSWKTAATSLLEAVWGYWQCIDKHDRAQEKEKEELYVYKTQHTSVKEEEEDTLEQLFPNYSHCIEPSIESNESELEESQVPHDSYDMEKQKDRQLALMHFTSTEMMNICGLYIRLYCYDCPKTILPIAQAISVPFSTIYDLTASLMRKGSPVPGM